MTSLLKTKEAIKARHIGIANVHSLITPVATPNWDSILLHKFNLSFNSQKAQVKYV